MEREREGEREGERERERESINTKHTIHHHWEGLYDITGHTHLVQEEEVSGVVDDVLNDQGLPKRWLGGGGRDKRHHHETLHHQLTVLWIRETVQVAL